MDENGTMRHLAFLLGMFLWNEAQQFASAPLTVVDVVALAISSCRHGRSQEEIRLATKVLKFAPK